MASGTSTQWGSDVGVQQMYEAGFVNLIYENGFQSLWPKEASRGGYEHRWKVLAAAGGAVETFTEGQAEPTPAAVTPLNASLTYLFFRDLTRVTGATRDAIRNGGAFAGFDIIDADMATLASQIRDLMSTTFLGTGASGIQLGIDSTSNYAGINRSTYSQWGSYENAVSGVLTFAALDDMREAIRDNDRGGAMRLVLCPHNQVTNIQRLVGAPGVQNSGYRVDLTQSGGSLQLAPLYAQTTFGEAAVVGLGDMTDTVILGLDTSIGTKIVVNRNMQVEFDRSGDDRLAIMSTSATFVVPNPRPCGKLTGVTA